MKKFLITFAISLTCVYVIHITLFQGAYTYESISNALFIVGIFMFFFGLLSITDANKIFLILNYSIKSALYKKNFKYKTYYDYYIENERNGITPFTIAITAISIIYITISYILAHFALAN